MDRRISSKALLFFLCLAYASLISCKGSADKVNDEDVLAQIEDFYVSTTHFENAFREYYYRTGQVLTSDDQTKQAILNSEFNTYVLAVYAEDLHLNETEYARQQ